MLLVPTARGYDTPPKKGTRMNSQAVLQAVSLSVHNLQGLLTTVRLFKQSAFPNQLPGSIEKRRELSAGPGRAPPCRLPGSSAGRMFVARIAGCRSEDLGRNLSQVRTVADT